MKVKNVLFVLCLLFCCSCSSVNQEFVKTVEASWNIIYPEYYHYVKNDEKLNDLAKDIRLQTAEGLSRLIKEAKENEPEGN